MFASIKHVIKSCTTENDGESYDMARVVALSMVASGFPAFLALCAYSVYASPEHRFDMISFGTAFGAMLAGVAAVTAGVAMKQRSDT
jgi:hypothetical protein